jgi:hypothetical protein
MIFKNIINKFIVLILCVTKGSTRFSERAKRHKCPADDGIIQLIRSVCRVGIAANMSGVVKATFRNGSVS